MTVIKDAVAFVVGGSSGIGLGVAKALCIEGARVAITYRRDDHRDEALKQCRAINADVIALAMDVTDRYAFEATVSHVENTLGSIDIFCNSAGISIFGPMENATHDDWDWVFNVNVGGVINGLITVIPRMIQRGTGGHIVTIGSMAGFVSGPEAGIYSASKFAVRGIAESLYFSLAKHRIAVSLVAPGLVDSNIHEALLSRPPSLSATGMLSGEETIDMIKSILRLGLSPDEVGARIVDGIRRNEFYIFTHPDHADDLREAHSEIMSAIPAGKIPEYRREIEDARRRNRREAKAMAEDLAAISQCYSRSGAP